MVEVSNCNAEDLPPVTGAATPQDVVTIVVAGAEEQNGCQGNSAASSAISSAQLQKTQRIIGNFSWLISLDL